MSWLTTFSQPHLWNWPKETTNGIANQSLLPRMNPLPLPPTVVETLAPDLIYEKENIHEIIVEKQNIILNETHVKKIHTLGTLEISQHSFVKNAYAISTITVNNCCQYPCELLSDESIFLNDSCRVSAKSQLQNKSSRVLPFKPSLRK